MVRNIFWGLTIKDEVTHIKPKVSFKITKVNKPRQSKLDVRSKAEEGGAERISEHL